MWIVLVVVVVVVVVVATVAVLRRPSGDDLGSVRNYHAALGTLEHLSDQASEQAAAPTDRPAGTGGRGGTPHAAPRSYRRSGALAADRGLTTSPTDGGSVPPVPVRGSGEFPDPETPLVFDDARPRDLQRREVTPDGIPVSRTDRAQRLALDSMNRRPRRGTTAAVVVAVVVLFGVLAYIGSRHSSSNHLAGSTTATTKAPAHAASHAKDQHASSHRGHPATTTTTTVPSQIVATSATSLAAVYPVTAASYQVKISATGECWVLATNASTGATLWTGTLQAGASQVVAATGITKVELGAPSASLAVNAVPVVLPPAVHTPFVATFQPTASVPAAGAATTTTTTTTGTTPP